MSDFNLFIYKIFSSSDLIQFHLYLIFKKKNYLHLLYQKNLLQNFNLATKIILLVFTKNELIFTILFTKVFQFVFIKKNDLYKLLKK